MRPGWHLLLHVPTHRHLNVPPHLAAREFARHPTPEVYLQRDDVCLCRCQYACLDLGMGLCSLFLVLCSSFLVLCSWDLGLWAFGCLSYDQRTKNKELRTK